MKEVDILIQARATSTRYPNKVVKEICDVPIYLYIYKRLSNSKLKNRIIFIIPDTSENDSFAKELEKHGLLFFRGSELDVLNRYAEAVKFYKCKNIVRITCDCPLVDPKILDQMIEEYCLKDYEYYSNVSPPTFPDGLDIEIFPQKSILDAENKAKNHEDREHVTSYIRQHSFNKGNFQSEHDYSHIRLTVDYPEDLEIISRISSYFWPKLDFSFSDVISFVESLDKDEIDSSFIRNEGLLMSNGQKLWKRANSVIPGGTMLLSKNPNLYLPNKWPSYFASAKGCKVTDYDKNTYLDFTTMGIGACSLGYANKDIDDEVISKISLGNMTTLLAKEEVELAEKLLSINSWAGKVRFARTGGEANAIAIRIARAFSNNPNVAVCGYHGWHDWYLAGNIKNKEVMEEHLIDGLKTDGVPEHLKDSTFPFYFNDYDALEKLVEEKNIGIIKMEVERFIEPDNGYLKKVRNLCDAKNIILIFDECTSGFRETFGGIYKKHNVIPDMAMFGKALGNGYAVTAVVGKDNIMDAAKNTFISSTFWTERIGSVAALKTLEVMEKIKSWEVITNIGSKVQGFWFDLEKEYGFGIDVFGFPALTGFKFPEYNQEIKTFITQEMLKHNILATNVIYSSISHEEHLDNYFEALASVFNYIGSLDNLSDVTSLLEYPVSENAFSRLN